MPKLLKCNNKAQPEPERSRSQSHVIKKTRNQSWSRCQAKFLTCEISDFKPCTHAQSNILHTKYADKNRLLGLRNSCLGKYVGLGFG